MLSPLQATFVDDGVVLIAVGCVIVNDRDAVHELASEMMQVYAPAANEDIELVLAPVVQL